MWKASNVDHDELMKQLDEVPGVKEHMESFPVLMALQIIARRMDLRWTQEQLAECVTKMTGQPITQTTISRIEGASPGIKGDTYDKVLRALGMTQINIQFENPSSEMDMEIRVKSSSFA